MRPAFAFFLIFAALTFGPNSKIVVADEPTPVTLTDRLHHLRTGGEREWSNFPQQAEAERLELTFSAEANAAEHTLAIRQQDVKQPWRIRLNEQELGRLVMDENDMLLYFTVAPNALKSGENRLIVEQVGDKPKVDDVRVGEIRLISQPQSVFLDGSTIEVRVRDADSAKPLPSRITILSAGGALQSVGAESNDTLAVRPGVIYTANGEARFGLPPGKYTLYAGRGFEYSLAQSEVEVQAGETIEQVLQIRREVPTSGYVASDTHVHTLTHSGHGDATIQERMITLAAEGVELPIATDHNRHIDYEPTARQLGVRRYFTPLIGNEVTTSLGHFNVFPSSESATLPDHRAPTWEGIFAEIHRTPEVKAVILNHARDLHSGVRPFGVAIHNEIAGANITGWKLRANAMEVINSGATQTEPMQLIRDWMAALNHGHLLTPVGASDSHDVARHFVGQGRTYIRARDDDPAAISADEAVNNFVQGRVMVSYGLLAALTINEKYASGELAILPDDTVQAHVRVHGPHWVSANKVMLFSNGELIHEQLLDPSQRTNRPGVIAEIDWELPRQSYDTHLVAVAVGPGIQGLWWPTAKPYQPTSPEFTPTSLACSGAVWLDGDGDGRRTPAVEYAQLIVAKSQGDLAVALGQLNGLDMATSVQVAHLWQTEHRSLLEPAALDAITAAAPQVREAFTRYLAAWRENEKAKVDQARR